MKKFILAVLLLLFGYQAFAIDYSLGLGYSRIYKKKTGPLYDVAIMVEDTGLIDFYTLVGVNAKLDYSRIGAGFVDKFDRIFWGLGSAINITDYEEFKMSYNMFCAAWVLNDYKLYVNYDSYYKNFSIGVMYSFEPFESYAYQNYTDDDFSESYEYIYRDFQKKDLYYEVPFERVEQAFLNSRKILKSRYSDTYFHSELSDRFSASVINNQGNILSLDVNAKVSAQGPVKVSVIADTPDNESREYLKEFIEFLDYDLLPLADYFVKYPAAVLDDIEPVEEIAVAKEVDVVAKVPKEKTEPKPYVENAFKKMVDSHKNKKNESGLPTRLRKKPDMVIEVKEKISYMIHVNAELSEDYYEKALLSLNKDRYLEASVFFWNSIKYDPDNEKAKLGYLKSVEMILPSSETLRERESYIADINDVIPSVKVEKLTVDEAEDFVMVSKRLEKMISLGFSILGNENRANIIERKKRELEKFSGNLSASRRYFIQAYSFYKAGDYERANLYFWTSIKYDNQNQAAKIWLFKTVTLLMPDVKTVIEAEQYFADIDLLFYDIQLDELNENYKRLYQEVKEDIEKLVENKDKIIGNLIQ